MQTTTATITTGEAELTITSDPTIGEHELIAIEELTDLGAFLLMSWNAADEPNPYDHPDDVITDAAEAVYAVVDSLRDQLTREGPAAELTTGVTLSGLEVEHAEALRTMVEQAAAEGTAIGGLEPMTTEEIHQAEQWAKRLAEVIATAAQQSSGAAETTTAA